MLAQVFQAILQDSDSAEQEAERRPPGRTAPRTMPFAPQRGRSSSAGPDAAAAAPVQQLPHVNGGSAHAASEALHSPQTPLSPPLPLPPPPLPREPQQPNVLPAPSAVPPPPVPAHMSQGSSGQTLFAVGALTVRARSEDAPTQERGAKRSRTEATAQPPPCVPDQVAAAARCTSQNHSSQVDVEAEDEADDEDALLYPPTPPPDMIPLDSSSDASGEANQALEEAYQAHHAANEVGDMELCYIPMEEDPEASGGEALSAPGTPPDLLPDLPPGLDTPRHPQAKPAAAPAAEHTASKAERMQRAASECPPGLAEPAPARGAARSASRAPTTAQVTLPNGGSAKLGKSAHQQGHSSSMSNGNATAPAAAAAADSDVDMLDDLADDVALPPLPLQQWHSSWKGAVQRQTEHPARKRVSAWPAACAEAGGRLAAHEQDWGLVSGPPEAVARVKLLLAQRRLCLVLDLDHTLLNSARFTEVDASHTEVMRPVALLTHRPPLVPLPVVMMASFVGCLQHIVQPLHLTGRHAWDLVHGWHAAKFRRTVLAGRRKGGCAQELLARLRSDARLPEGQRGLFRLDHIGMWTKLRPGVRDFLAAAAPLFEMWIHTNGTRCGAGWYQALYSLSRSFSLYER